MKQKTILRLVLKYFFIISASVFSSLTVFANVCSRSPEMVKFLEHQTDKACGKIQKSDLAKIEHVKSSTAVLVNMMIFVSFLLMESGEYIGDYLSSFGSSTISASRSNFELMVSPDAFTAFKQIFNRSFFS